MRQRLLKTVGHKKGQRKQDGGWFLWSTLLVMPVLVISGVAVIQEAAAKAIRVLRS